MSHTTFDGRHSHLQLHLLFLQVLTTNHEAIFFRLDVVSLDLFLLLRRLCCRLLLSWLLHENGSNLVAALLLKLHLAQPCTTTVDRHALNDATFNRVRVRLRYLTLLRSVSLCADERSRVLLLLRENLFRSQLLLHIGVGVDRIQSDTT